MKNQMWSAIDEKEAESLNGGRRGGGGHSSRSSRSSRSSSSSSSSSSSEDRALVSLVRTDYTINPNGGDSIQTRTPQLTEVNVSRSGGRIISGTVYSGR
jgi:hypothetical protein